MQRSKLTGAWQGVPRKHYIAATAANWLEQSPFVHTAARLRQDPYWTVIDLDSGHNFLAHGPDELLAVLLAVA